MPLQALDDRPVNGAIGGPQPSPAIASDELGPSFWRETLKPYAAPHVGRAVLGVATSLVPYLALTALMYAALDVSVWLVVALMIPDDRLPRADVHHLPRLHARLLPAVAARERVARHHMRRARLLAVSQLALRARRPSRQRGRPRRPRRRRRRDEDRRRVRAMSRGAAARLPAHAQPARAARPRPAVGADHRAQARPALGGQALRAQDHRDGHRAVRAARRPVRARRLARGAADPARARAARGLASASGCSTSSISSRASTGSARTTGATRRPRCRAARTCACRRSCSGSPATSACTTCTTSTRGSRTTTCSARTTTTRSSTAAASSACGRPCSRCG